MGNPNYEAMQDSAEMEDVAQSLASSVPNQPHTPERHLPDWYMEFEDDLLHMEHWLKGEFFDPSDEMNPWKKQGEVLVNQAGVVFIVGYLRGTGLSKNKIMTNIPNWDEAMRSIQGVCFGLNEALHKHKCYGDFDIDLTGIAAINEYAFDLVYSSTLRALFGKENDRVRATTSTETRIVAGGQPQGSDPTRPRSPLDVILGR